MNLIRIVLLSIVVVAPASAAELSSGLPRSSPFVPAGAAGSTVEAASEAIEFAGVVTTVGKRTDLIFHDKATKRNHWIAKGETKEGISVLNYDDQRQQVVVKVNGAEKTLALRKVSTPRGGPRPVAPQPTGFNVSTAPAPAVVAGTESILITPGTGSGQAGVTISAAPAARTAPEAPETSRVRQETEARMLVSDLLEIGMAQRKAYEEAQRKAASGENPAATAPEPPK